MKKRFAISRTIAGIAVAALLTVGVNTVKAQSADAPVKNIVIVHGAFADASGFEGVYKILTAHGYKVTLVQDPLTSLEDDVDATKLAIDRQDGPVVLVGHSWGGTVITQAGTSDKVKSLVYVAAFAPAAGESTLDLIKSAPALPVNAILPPDAKGFVYLDQAKFREAFSADVAKDKSDFMAVSQVPIAGKSFVTPVTEAAWKTKPAYGIVATADNSINPVLERKMYERGGFKVTEVKGSHTVYISNPKAVAEVIERAAAGK